MIRQVRSYYLRCGLAARPRPGDCTRVQTPAETESFDSQPGGRSVGCVNYVLGSGETNREWPRRVLLKYHLSPVGATEFSRRQAEGAAAGIGANLRCPPRRVAGDFEFRPCATRPRYVTCGAAF